uniref:RNA-directed DNA polymerase, eukaryota n=1 Tax=Tanacetum cinerariifolium TaxID=118510 RepID=A0A6L2P2B8_TANCI|nr:RNA-directed DNA polymerase, eukaryota [Tanacetum cinerariifolium]
MGSYRSKEDDVSRISTSIYISNFPESFSAKDLFHSCKQYGHVVDTFIRFKRSNDGKRFGFVRFINVFNVERLKFGYNRNINNVRAKEGVTTGLSKSYVHAVKVKNMFGALECDSMPSIVLDDECLISKDLSKALLGRENMGVGSWFSVLKQASSDFIPEGKIVWVEIEGVPFKLWSKNTFKRIAAKWGELLDVDDQEEEGFHSKRLCDVENMGVGSWFSVLKQASSDFIPEGKIVWVEIEGVPFKLWSKNTFKRIAAKWGELLDVNDQEEEGFHSKRLCDVVFLIRAKEVPGCVPEFVDDSDDDDESDNGFKDGDAKVQDGGSCGDDSDEEVPLGGSSFTWCRKSATKMSKLDRSQLNIRGIMLDGKWTEKLNNVKLEFLHHFRNRFDKPTDNRVHIDMNFPKSITIDQQMDLECAVSKEELKRAVWKCDIPNGCNSCFIALIPKVPDANLVKDFRPISLIGSMYKIIAKILANRLVGVLRDIVNEVQFAFITERQILDGPFILNEVIQLCKLKKNQSLIFKVDFEKAYDSVRLDFLDGVLKKFGFGNKWCAWIQSFLRSSRGFIIINDSPTEEFQFFKGLKQGLRINMCKSKITGVNVGDEKVKSAASKLGCLILNTPFSYLESIRCHFFNGHELNSNKAAWVKWKSVLASKEKRGLGVSSLYALDKALMMKWVWRFYSQKESLWARVIKAIYGDDGQVGKVSKAGSRSCWRNIVNEVRILSNQGIKVLDYMRIKLENEESTAFWDDNWIGGNVLKYSFLPYSVQQTDTAYSNPLNTTYRSSDTTAEITMTKVIKEEFEQLGLLKIDDDLFTYDTQLGMIFNEFSRLSEINNDLFTYEIEFPKPTPCDEQQTSNPTHNDLREYEWKLSYEECEKIC